MCVSGCPYKKVYFNHKTGKAEKCTFCYPRIEVGIPTVCSETCVGRLRYIGLMLYDADAVLEAAAVEDEHDLYEAQRGVFLDPRDPEVERAALAAGIEADWIEAAKKSPVLRLITDYKVALPLHPEYRTMPMVWYIPPLSPVVDVVKDTGEDAEDRGNLFAAIDTLRIPVEYLANLFTAGDVEPVDGVLKKLAAMRSYMRDINLGREPDASIPAAVGMTEEEMYEMFRLLAIAKYADRYVIPPAHAEQAHALEELATDCAVGLRRGRFPLRPGAARRGRGLPDAGGGGELPDAPGPADRPTRSPRRTTSPAGSTSSTGTARARPRACSPPRRGRRSVMFRRRGADGRDEDAARTWAVCSALLDYPTERAGRRPSTTSRRWSPDDAAPASRCSTTCGDATLAELQQDYVATFDHTRKCALYLTYFAYGDTRRRGAALVAVQGGLPARRRRVVRGARRAARPPVRRPAVRRHRRRDAIARELLEDHRAGVEMLRLALSRWRNDDGIDGLAVGGSAAWPSAAPCASSTGDEADAVRRLVEQGPPAEEVGLSGYGADPALATGPALISSATIPVGAPR